MVILADNGNLYCSNNSWTAADANAHIQSVKDENKTKVKRIYLWTNHLEVIPESVLLFTNAKELYLGLNRIEQFPAWTSKLMHITMIDLGRNKLRTLPVYIGDLVNLEQFYLHDNDLSSLPSSMLKMTKLKSIWLANNTGLPRHLQINIDFAHANTQQLLFEIALEERRVNARNVTAAWMLGGQQTTLHRDVCGMISQMIYATRVDEMWEESSQHEQNE